MDQEVLRSRGYLVHWDVPGATQFLSWRLYDTVTPEQWQAWRLQYAGEEQKAELYRAVEANLDEGRGSACLRNPVVGRLVMESLLGGHLEDYVLHAAVVMPNHVHAVLTVGPETNLNNVMQRIKGSSSRSVNQLLGRTGRLWQPEYFDRLVRNPDHFERCIEYTHWNPVKAKLVVDPRHYACSTANPFYAERIRAGTGSGAD